MYSIWNVDQSHSADFSPPNCSSPRSGSCATYTTAVCMMSRNCACASARVATLRPRSRAAWRAKQSSRKAQYSATLSLPGASTSMRMMSSSAPCSASPGSSTCALVVQSLTLPGRQKASSCAWVSAASVVSATARTTGTSWQGCSSKESRRTWSVANACASCTWYGGRVASRWPSRNLEMYWYRDSSGSTTTSRKPRPSRYGQSAGLTRMVSAAGQVSLSQTQRRNTRCRNSQVQSFSIYLELYNTFIQLLTGPKISNT
uniref:Uncharacterized protein n=1 Tax=Spironucleus salmonicida TaxID=348837 RepID=V6LHA9_9EUKA|eukprot:EST43668.1 Hypothetical protein SS50377_16711 [Spironucleus salmonicida]